MKIFKKEIILGSTFKTSFINRLIRLFLSVSIAASGIALAITQSVSTEDELIPERRKAIVSRVSTALREFYVFPERAEEMGDLLKNNLQENRKI